MWARSFSAMKWILSLFAILTLHALCTLCQDQTEDETASVDIPWFIWIVIVIVAVFLILLIGCTAYFTVYNIKVFCRSPPSKRSLPETELQELDGTNSPDAHQHDDIIHIKDWELDRKSITLRNQLGIGEFGPIYDAELELRVNAVSRVVVKVFQQGTSQDLVRFREEVEEIKYLQHPNVGRVLGLVTQPPYYLVMELTVNGDLKTFLLTASQEQSDQRLSPGQLVALITDVAVGLSYMEQMQYIHKDVAARNCIVMQNLSVKITDFRLGKFLHRSEYTVGNDGSLMPLRWMAPESIPHNKYTLKSAVWSYGVLMWEVVSRGGFPYKDLGDWDVYDAGCNSRLSLEQPTECPDAVYQEMLQCWSYEPNHRPSMENLHQMLKSSILTNTYAN